MVLGVFFAQEGDMFFGDTDAMVKKRVIERFRKPVVGAESKGGVKFIFGGGGCEDEYVGGDLIGAGLCVLQSFEKVQAVTVGELEV